MCRFATLLTTLTILIAAASGREGAGQQNPKNAWYEGFEGPQVSWQILGGDAQYDLLAHQRVSGEGHNGTTGELLQIKGKGGTELFVGHDVGRPRIIDDLLLTLWVKADRPGIRMGAQIVLPRTADPRTGRPVSVAVHGSSYSMVGRWQQLRVDDLPRLLMRQTWVLHAQLGPNVDVREAYVERVLLNVYGGPGATQVAIDDLDVAGHVPLGQNLAPAAQPLQADPPPTAPIAASRENAAKSPRLSGSVLLADDRPLFPRIVQFQGEPLSFLRQLGFNAVWIAQPATTEFLEEAGRLGLWVVCPPPAGSEANPPEIGPAYARVLAWDLGCNVGGERLEAITRLARQLKVADRAGGGRPLVCRPTSELRGYSRAVDILILGRSPLGTTLELSDYGVWVRQQPRLTVAGAPLWTTVQTQPAESLRRQWAALAPEGPVPATFSSEQIRLVAYTAITAGSRGLLFESFSPLNAADPDTRCRALALELLNLELDLVEPWAAAGGVVATVPASEPGISATLLQTEHGRLLVPLWSAPRSQCVSGQSAANNVTFIVPGVPETNKAYLMLPGELRPFHPPRKAGGVRLTLDEFDLTALVLLTQNPNVVAAMSRRAAQVGPRAAEIEHELAAMKFQSVVPLAARLTRANPKVPQAGEWVAQAQKFLQQSRGFLASKNAPAAYIEAQRAMRPLRLLERAHWEAAATQLRSPVVSPLAVAYPTLAGHWAFSDRMAGAQAQPNLLSGGDFEDLRLLFENGWQHLQHPMQGIATTAELTPDQPRGGRFALRLSAKALEKNDLPIVESPPLWITTPPIPVQAGEIVRISGWVRIPAPIVGSVDGLMIVDSLGGEPLAERIVRTNGWEQFTLYRAAPAAGNFTVTFALAGLGDALLDEVTIQPLAWPSRQTVLPSFP